MKSLCVACVLLLISFALNVLQLDLSRRDVAKYHSNTYDSFDGGFSSGQWHSILYGFLIKGNCEELFHPVLNGGNGAGSTLFDTDIWSFDYGPCELYYGGSHR